MHAEVLILGAGPAGLSAAKAACRQKKGVILAGAEPYLPYWRPRLSEILASGGRRRASACTARTGSRKTEWNAGPPTGLLPLTQ